MKEKQQLIILLKDILKLEKNKGDTEKKDFRKKLIIFSFSVLMFFIIDFVNADTTTYLSCGNAKGIAVGVPALVRIIINLIKIGVPIIIILMGAVDFGKAVIGDDKELSKAIKKFVRRCIGGAGVFFVVFFVQFFLKLIGNDSDGVMECIACFTSDSSDCSSYQVENDDYSKEVEQSKKEREEIEKKREEERKKREEEAKKKEEENKNNNNNNNNSSSGNNPVKPGEVISTANKGMTLKQNGKLKYWEYVPNNPRENMALVIFLHGSGECNSPNSMLRVSFSKFMNEGVYANYPAIFIAPNTTSGSCSWVDKVSSVKNLIDSVVEEYKIDMQKRYLLETERYFKLYGVRRDDMNNYDLVIDTTNMTILEVKEKILKEYKIWLTNNNME